MDRELQIISAVSIALPAIAFIWGKVKYKRESSLSLVIFFIYYIVAFLTQITLGILWSMGINNLIFIRIYLIFELPLLAIFLLSLFKGKAAVNFVTISFFTLIPVLCNLYYNDLQIIPFESIVINCLFLTILSVITIRKVKLLDDSLRNDWYYYIIMGIVIYSANNSIIFGFTSLGLRFVYGIHATLSIIQNLLFALGVLVYYKS